jgi:hypothetical protein
MPIRLSEDDHARMDEVVEDILKAHHTGEVTLRQAGQALAQIITAAAIGNETEVRAWINDPERFARWKELCQR